MLWVCAACTTSYSVGAPRCPHCGSTDRKDDDMPKSTVHGGPSNEAEEVDVIGAPTIGAPRIGEGESTADEPVDDTVIADPPADEPVQVDDSTKVPAKKAAPTKASK